jgi:hypothetical protein
MALLIQLMFLLCLVCLFLVILCRYINRFSLFLVRHVPQLPHLWARTTLHHLSLIACTNNQSLEPIWSGTSHLLRPDAVPRHQLQALMALRPECRSVARSLSGRGPKGESDASITAGSEIVDLLRRLNLIRRSDSFIIAIRVEAEYRSVARSLFG